MIEKQAIQSKHQQFKAQIRAQQHQQYFKAIRQEVLKINNGQHSEIQLENDKAVHPSDSFLKSWGYLLDDLHNFSSIGQLAEVYNKLRDGFYRQMKNDVVQVLLNKIKDEIELRAASNCGEENNGIIFILVLIFKELNEKFRPGIEHLNDLIKAMTMFNMSNQIKAMLGINDMKAITD